MALVVFLRGVNVGGHRTFRPSILARQLSGYDVLNVGAAGTFVVRKPVLRTSGSRAKFRTALLGKLPFEAEIVMCEGRDLMRLETENPFGTPPFPPDIVRFVSILSKAGGVRASLPVAFPQTGSGWCGCLRPQAVRVRNVPSSHEDHRLSWPDRQTVRSAGHDSELEHNNYDHTNVEESQGRAQGSDC
jgi:hypothetical protein